MGVVERDRATWGVLCYWDSPAEAGSRAKEKIPELSCRMGFFLW